MFQTRVRSSALIAAGVLNDAEGAPVRGDGVYALYHPDSGGWRREGRGIVYDAEAATRYAGDDLLASASQWAERFEAFMVPEIIANLTERAGSEKPEHPDVFRRRVGRCPPGYNFDDGQRHCIAIGHRLPRGGSSAPPEELPAPPRSPDIDVTGRAHPFYAQIDEPAKKALSVFSKPSAQLHALASAPPDTLRFVLARAGAVLGHESPETAAMLSVIGRLREGKPVSGAEVEAARNQAAAIVKSALVSAALSTLGHDLTPRYAEEIIAQLVLPGPQQPLPLLDGPVRAVVDTLWDRAFVNDHGQKYNHDYSPDGGAPTPNENPDDARVSDEEGAALAADYFIRAVVSSIMEDPPEQWLAVKSKVADIERQQPGPPVNPNESSVETVLLAGLGMILDDYRWDVVPYRYLSADDKQRYSRATKNYQSLSDKEKKAFHRDWEAAQKAARAAARKLSRQNHAAAATAHLKAAFSAADSKAATAARKGMRLQHVAAGKFNRQQTDAAPPKIKPKAFKISKPRGLRGKDFGNAVARRFKEPVKISKPRKLRPARALRKLNNLREWRDDPYRDLNENHRFDAVIVPLFGDAATRIAELGARIDPLDLAPKGLEKEPHVTLCIADLADGRLFSQWLVDQRFAPPRLAFGTTGAFDEGKDGIPIIVRVDSPDLCQMHDRIVSLFGNVSEYEYQPHATVAYVRPGTAHKYVGMESGIRAMRLDTLAVVLSDGRRQEFTLQESAQESARNPMRGTTSAAPSPGQRRVMTEAYSDFDVSYKQAQRLGSAVYERLGNRLLGAYFDRRHPRLLIHVTAADLQEARRAIDDARAEYGAWLPIETFLNVPLVRWHHLDVTAPLHERHGRKSSAVNGLTEQDAPNFALDDVQFYYDMQIASGEDTYTAIQRTRQRFNIESLQVDPMGRIISPNIVLVSAADVRSRPWQATAAVQQQQQQQPPPNDSED